MAMYDHIEACVRANSDLSDFFDCPHGLKQACVASPTLFSIIINQTAIHVQEGGKHGLQLLPGKVELLILLFAGDIILMSAGLVYRSNSITCKRQERNLEVKCDKTKIMIFRKGSYIKECEKCFIYGKKLAIVNRYAYLGFLFTATLSVNQCVTHLGKKGKIASFDVIKVYRCLDPTMKDTFFKIFSTQVQPILL